MSIATTRGDAGENSLAGAQAGVDARLRDEKTPGARWSRAW
jgi:hypothetical protein